MAATKLLDVVEGWTEELGPFALLADGVAIDPTPYTVTLLLRDRFGAAVTTTSKTRTATAGAYFTPAAGDLLAAKSPYHLHWKVVDGSGAVVFFPDAEADRIVVHRP
jgi:hypothetical protein